MNIISGIDIGSATTKSVILSNKKILGFSVIPTGGNANKSGLAALDIALDNAKVKRNDVKTIVATGYGRVSADFADKVVTEITCHGFGAKWLHPRIGGVIDIGGQDSKAIVVKQDGNIEEFVMNDKCAAGTGRFIELIANVLQIPLENVGKIALKGKNPADISSMCAVFAESEVVSLIAHGVSEANILAGIHQAIARRVISMAHRTGIKNRTMAITGGVAKNIGMVKALEKELGTKIVIPKEPQIIGALGAALLGAAN